MKVKHLIEFLQKFDGETPVYIVTDHGQCPQQALEPTLCYTNDLKYMLWEEVEERRSEEYPHPIVLI